jgi:predicted phage terminase large subunit-like protein
LEPVLQRGAREAATQFLDSFVSQAWPVYRPGVPYLLNWHIDLICEFLTMITLGKLRKLIINIPPRYMKPLDSESKILMASGYRKLLKEIVVGDSVISGKGRPARVLEVHNQGLLETVEITTFSGKVLKAAIDHPVLTPEGWINAGDLKVGMVLASVIPEDRSRSNVPDEAFRLAGYFIGDGCTAPGPGTAIRADITCFDPIEESDIFRCAEILGFECNKSKAVAVSRFNLKGGVRAWLREIDMAGKGAWDKRVPNFVYSGNRSQVAQFIGAYFACDGTMHKRTPKHKSLLISFSSVNRPLLEDIQHLLLRLGIRSRVRPHKAKYNNFTKGEYLSWTLDLSTKDDTTRFIDIIPVYSEKSERLKKDRVPRTKFNNLYLPDEISEIKSGNSECMCLTLDRDRSFTANDLVVSNSSLVSVFWPCWEWIRKPEQRWIFVSYGYDLSMTHAYSRKLILSSPWYLKNWGHIVQINPRYSAIGEFMNLRQGIMTSTSTGGALTGKGGNRIVIDDPTNPREALSQTPRDSANSWFGDTCSTRLDDKMTGAFVLIQQRIHDVDMTGYLTGLQSSDLTAHIIENANGWTLLRIPAIADVEEDIVFPLSKRVVKRKVGDVLWEQREPLTELQTQKFVMDWQYEAQYQQRPSSLKGQIFSRDWIRLYEHLPGQKPLGTILSVDASFKDTETSSYVVIQIWRRYGVDNYLIDQLRDKMSFIKTLEEIDRLLAAYPSANTKLIEDKANGTAIIEMMRRKYSGVIAVSPTDSKEARAISVTPCFKSGNVWVPGGKSWTHDYLNEMTLFPGGRWKDQVDCTTQALKYMEELWGNKPFDDVNYPLRFIYR